MAARRVPTALIVLDGYGDAPAGPWNAISQARPRFIESLAADYPRGQLLTSGECVGLPAGLMGNSEVGHMNLGAGRIIWQDITRVDVAIRDGLLVKNTALRAAAEHAKKGGGSLHLLGLVSDGGVHSSDRHLAALLAVYKELGVAPDRCFVHAITDGRDTAPSSGEGFVAALESTLRHLRFGAIATVSGRYFAMDRDQRWERVEKAYRCIVEGVGRTAESARDAVRQAYQRGETDEFIEPTLVLPQGRVKDGDAVVFFNFRADRAREITLALMDPSFPSYGGFATAQPRPKLFMASMTRYRADFPSLGVVEAFSPLSFGHLLTNVMAENGLTQLRIAESEKEPHVTYFFSGGSNEIVAGEERIKIPSQKVATYDLKPEMSAPEVTARLMSEIRRDAFDLIVLNLANPDMVGHTGKLDAAVAAVKAVDAALAQVIPAIVDRDGTVLLTADHGNCEKMFDEETGEPHTAHTTNPVPLHLVGKRWKGAKLREGGILADVSPTLLEIMGLAQPSEMTAKSLIGK